MKLMRGYSATGWAIVLRCHAACLTSATMFADGGNTQGSGGP
jgi:hypothetical protein